jgi:hypothetical protein
MVRKLSIWNIKREDFQCKNDLLDCRQLYKKGFSSLKYILFCWIKIVQHIKIQYLFYIYFYLSLVYVGIQCRQHNHGQFTHEMISHAWQKCLVSMYSCLQSNKSFLHWKSSLFIFHIDNFLTIDWYFYWTFFYLLYLNFICRYSVADRTCL